MREFLTVPELAERWSISDQSVRRKIRRGVIAAIHTPGARSIRVPASFVREHEATFSRASTPITASSSTTI
jgi:excisionase family DNA binding protein